MVFSSIQFILIFCPIFFGCYYLAPKKLKNLVLLLGSIAFYYVGTKDNLDHFVLFLLSILAGYLCALAIERFARFKKLFLFIGIMFFLLSLGTFKYTGFIVDEIGRYVETFDVVIDLVLPLGISFYTFQGISYITDVYRGTVKAERNLIKYAVYISMFEQLISGPIVTYPQVKKELDDRSITIRHVFHGLSVFVFGLGLKVLLANPIGKLWSQILAIGFDSISTPLAWMGIFAFSFQIYFDFFGYSLMTVGLGEMLGFKIPKNFDHPYTSKTMTEFWRKWHITLGAWFREYVYIPLGGNRNGKLALVRNLLLVWFLTGIWHGAGNNFVLWGTILFVIIMIEKFAIGKFLNRFSFVGHLYMILLIPLTWAVFGIEEKDQLILFMTRLFPFFGQGVWSIFRYDYIKYLEMYYPFLIAGVLFSTKLPYRLLKKIKNGFVITAIISAILIACIYLIYRGNDDPFLYFRF